jgi:hypothetical protein
MKYKVVKPFGKYKKGYILNDEKKEERRVIGRKLQEGGTVEKVGSGSKMMEDKYENKMIEKSEENKKKGGK